ncbi:sulfotransferase family protein [Gracilibacillus saliphilus]|uniref:sulfotransferase family protein n=1 Tax=Gracilibacillus saliphilus TaxID=543890 RepID=UPI0013D2D246|nr:sulfotransferase family protein [Gracilibacillus saliphilus]
MTGKIFCIGRNKTGTTSLKKAFEVLGYSVGKQREAENLLVNYIEGDFDSIIEHCNSATVFQDVPFSWPGTYMYLDRAFPESKFILTVRDSSEQWYNSITKFHSKKFADGHRTPTRNDLINSTYIFKGQPWLVHKHIYGIEGENTYDKEIMIRNYEKHNEEVKEHFKDRPEDLLVLNLSEKNSYKKFCDFLDICSPYTDFPWENKTSNVTNKKDNISRIKKKLKRMKEKIQ